MKIVAIAPFYLALMILYARRPLRCGAFGGQGKGIFDDKLSHGDELLGKLGHNQAVASSNGVEALGINCGITHWTSLNKISFEKGPEGILA